MNQILLRIAIGFIWLATGLGVLHPFYRAVGREHLAPLRLPDWLMFAACGLEILLGLRVLLGPPRRWLTVFQLALIAGFTLVLAIQRPTLLVDPFGVLSKNVTLAALIVTAQLVEREGWSRRAESALRMGLAFIWVWEGLMACILFQNEELQQVLAQIPLPFNDVSLLLTLAGVAEVLCGVSLFVLRGRPLRLLLALQMIGLVTICLLVSLHNPRLWFHPFGPITKNITLFLGSLVAFRAANEVS